MPNRFPQEMIGPRDIIRLSPNFVKRCMYPNIHQETANKIRNLRGRIVYIKYPRHTHLCFAFVQWMESRTVTVDNKRVIQWYDSDITSPWINLLNVELVKEW